MGSKVVEVNSEKCIGCYMCVLAYIRNAKQPLSPSEVPIRIQKDGSKFLVALDPNFGDPGKVIVDICPRGCFTILDDDK